MIHPQCTAAGIFPAADMILLTMFFAAEKLSIERSTGAVLFDSSDATEIFVKTDTGSILVPKTASGGKCKITTSTGDILFSVA